MRLGQLPNGIVSRIASSAVRSASPVLVDLARNLVDVLGSRYVEASVAAPPPGVAMNAACSISRPR